MQYPALLAAVVLTLAACGAQTPDAPTSQESAVAESRGGGAAADDATPPMVDEVAAGEELVGEDWDFASFPFPSCDEAGAAAGVPDVLEAAESEGPWEPQVPGAAFGLVCTWLTPEAAAANGGDLLSPQEFAHIGGLTMQLTVIPDPIPEEDARAFGFHVEDVRAQDIGGYVFAPSALDLAEPLSAIGTTVTVGSLDVSWGATGPLLNEVPALSVLTNDWGIDAAVAVHEVLRAS